MYSTSRLTLVLASVISTKGFITSPYYHAIKLPQRALAGVGVHFTESSPNHTHDVIEPNRVRPTTSKLQLMRRSSLTGIAIGLVAILLKSSAAWAGTSASSSTLILPTIPTLILTCLLPTLLGFYRSEYGVSYGYGTAMAASSFLVLSSLGSASGLQLLPSIPANPSAILFAFQSFVINLKSLLSSSLPAVHAASLLFYGTRLDLFLLYRELCLPRFRAIRERIEDRAKKQGSRWRRMPFVASCAFLYFCMMCPLLVTSRVCEGLSMSPGIKVGFEAGGLVAFLEQALRVLVGLTLSGFLLGAVGDLNKSAGKLLQGEDELVTGGIFRFFRHPNYTGEVIGWTSSCMAAFTAVAWKTAKEGGNGLALWKSMIPYLVMSVVGAIGIAFVLGTATAGLENRQREKYGGTEKYEHWTKSSWVGFTMGQRRGKSENVVRDNIDEEGK